MPTSEVEHRPVSPVCRHGWRGAPGDAPIVTPCPTCGKQSLFIGTGGHLTCAWVPGGSVGHGCPEPGVERAIEKLKAEVERLRAECMERAVRQKQAEARLREVVEAVRRYGPTHRIECDTVMHDSKKCSCGLDSFMRALAAAQPEEHGQ